MLKLLRKRFPGETKIEYLLLDGKGLSPIPERSVHGAFSYGVFVHLQHWDIYNYLCELKRVLKPGEKAIIQHGNTFSKLGWRQFLAELPSSLNRPKLPTAFTLFTPEIMKEFVQRAGLWLENCLTEIARRDAISPILSP
jgi:SAM-dependent methyltransferase